MTTIVRLLLVVLLATATIGCGGDSAKAKYSGKDMPKSSSEKQDQ